jgi:H/ACA ribonucleoprotein complex subunit 2
MAKDKPAKKSKKDAKPAAPDSPDTPAAAPPRPRGALLPIASPLADDKLAKKVLKLAKKASKRKQTKRGVKEVVKALRKGAKGVAVLAGDVSPLDVISHLPVFCESKGVPYIFVPSKDELGAAGLTKRPTSCMLVLAVRPKNAKPADDDAEFEEAYGDVAKRVGGLQTVQ